MVCIFNSVDALKMMSQGMLPHMIATQKTLQRKNSLSRHIHNHTLWIQYCWVCICYIMYRLSCCRDSSIISLFLCLCLFDVCMDCCTLRLEIRGRIGDQNQFKGILTANGLSGVGFSTLKVNEQPVEGRGRHLLSLEGRILCLPNARCAFVFRARVEQ